VFESWTTLTALSQIVPRIRLGHLVANNLLRTPSLVAKAAATFDVVSGGRLEFGIGAGWERDELEAYGYTLPPPAERVQRLEEAVEIVTALWTKPEATLRGRWYQVERAECDPKPLQQPHPPIWIGGAGERRTLRVVARHADVSNFGGSVDEWAHKCDVLRRHCADVGRDYESITRTWSHDVFVREQATEIDDAGSLGLWGEPVARWHDENLVGTPAHVTEKVARFVDHGCGGFVVWCSDAPSHRTLELFAQHVMPRFR
jgi:alkanesulfonate monooxygenase SsuD/methylene tetrahydromethanopterin reductase-like flavin-dependent oxidoreductase (luciferase family)